MGRQRRRWTPPEPYPSTTPLPLPILACGYSPRLHVLTPTGCRGHQQAKLGELLRQGETAFPIPATLRRRHHPHLVWSRMTSILTGAPQAQRLRELAPRVGRHGVRSSILTCTNQKPRLFQGCKNSGKGPLKRAAFAVSECMASLYILTPTSVPKTGTVSRCSM